MWEITKTYAESVPAMRFIGICYSDADRVNGGFGVKWGEWFQNNRFEPLLKLTTEAFKESYPDADDSIGFMRWKEGEPFQYWIGMFVSAGTPVPEGYDYVDLPAARLGVCWLHGPELELFANEPKCAEKLASEGYEVIQDTSGAWVFFERYGCPRFTTPDADGNVILDICHYIK